MKVLWIGSDRELVRMTCRILCRNGYTVSAAIGPEEATALLRGQRFDLVVLEHDMGKLQGARLIQAVREGPCHPHLLVISDDREEEVPLLQAGADDWVHKPYQMDVLLARMAALLRQK